MGPSEYPSRFLGFNTQTLLYHMLSKNKPIQTHSAPNSIWLRYKSKTTSVSYGIVRFFQGKGWEEREGREGNGRKKRASTTFGTIPNRAFLPTYARKRMKKTIKAMRMAKTLIMSHLLLDIELKYFSKCF